MAAPKVKLNHAAVRRLLRGDGTMKVLKRHADKIAAAAGPGHEVSTFVGRNRDRATVQTAHPVGATGKANLKRAMRAGRG